MLFLGPDVADDDELALDIYLMVRDSAVCKYHSTDRLDKAVNQLQQAGFHIIDLDVSATTSPELLRDIGKHLDFPDYANPGLDGFNDNMRDVDDGEGLPPDATGLAFVLRHFDAYHRQHQRKATDLLEILSNHHRLALLQGRRQVCLIQTDDPDLDLVLKGFQRPHWNIAEMFQWTRKPEDYPSLSSDT